jgi:hypothetical protein
MEKGCGGVGDVEMADSGGTSYGEQLRCQSLEILYKCREYYSMIG